MAGQEQNIDKSSLRDSKVQQSQAGRDAVSFQNSQDNQVTINNNILRLFGNSAIPQVDWEWGTRLLQKKELPEIRKRLVDTLGSHRLSMDVSFTEQLYWVNRTLQIDGRDGGTLDANQLLIETLGREDIEGKLLILGVPGVGKTTALLSLAEQLVLGALDQPKTLIPVLFELSTWRDDNQSIDKWLIEQLYEMHGGNRKHTIYERWLEQQVLLPLLDGLDELGLERQKKCTIKLNEFAQHYPQIVVCCRMREFEAANLKLKTFRGAVCLQPLSDSQIQDYLNGRNRTKLWSAIQGQDELRKLLEPISEDDPGLLRVPLFLKLVIDVYDPLKPISSKTDLLERYIERQLSKDTREQERRQELNRREWAYKRVEDEPHWQQTCKTLSWIAQQLQANNTVELLIEKMQPSWLESARLRCRYRLIFGLTVGLISGLIFGLTERSIFGLMGGLSFGLIIGLGRRLDKIEPVEEFQISMSRATRRKILDSLCSEIIVALIIMLSFGLIFGLIFRMEKGLEEDLISWLIFGLILMLFRRLIIELMVEMKQELKERLYPNQGIWKSSQNVLWTTALSYLLSMIAFRAISALGRVAKKLDWQPELGFIFHNLSLSLLNELTISLSLCFILGGGLACVQHLSLRLVLWWQSGVPWNLARFLNYCVERRLLLRVGGRYRFLHRELLDHFAQPHP